jgi:ribose 1,5-bisphosphate isomerase
MAKRTVQQIASDIRALKIQGARRIAQAALEGLVLAAQASRSQKKDQFYEELLAAARLLSDTRPTEPMMRNALEETLRYALAFIRTHPVATVEELKAALARHEERLLRQMEAGAEAIARIGAAEIPHGAYVLIHCHSTTIIRTLIKAKRLGKQLHVTCLETRPLYQGRMSARELCAAGIDTTLAVDSAAASLMSKMDLVLVGADAITAEGDLINKVGTYSLAQLAHAHSVRFLCAAEVYKFDPLTRLGRAEPIEQRDWEEVWGSGYYRREKRGRARVPKPAKLKVLNPAFDRTPARLLSAFITDEGLIPPAQMAIIAERKLSQSR